MNRSGKAVFKGSEFAVDNSKNQQRVYLEMSKEIKEKYPNIKVLDINTDRDLTEIEKEIIDFLNN